MSLFRLNNGDQTAIPPAGTTYFYVKANKKLAFRYDTGVESEVIPTNITTVSPTINDDSAAGFTVGQVWVNNSLDMSYICVDATNGAAIWNQIDGVSTGGGGGSVSGDVTQAAHGFVVGTPVAYDGVNWIKAKADSATTIGSHLVVAVLDVNTITISMGGVVSGLSGLVSGSYYYVSSTLAGGITDIEPSSPNFSNPILLASSSTTGWVLPFRASNAPTGAGSILIRNLVKKTSSYTVTSADSIIIVDPLAITTITLPDPSTVTNQVFDINHNSGASDVNIVASGGALIDGLALQLVPLNSSFSVVSDGIEYFGI